MSSRLVDRARTAGLVARLSASFVAFGILRHVVSLERIARLAWRPPARRGRDLKREARLVACVIKLGKLASSTDTNCLQRSLTLYRALSRAGASPQLWIGFQRELQGVSGHAWIVVDSSPLGEPPGFIETLVPTCAFGDRGRTVFPSQRTT